MKVRVHNWDTLLLDEKEVDGTIAEAFVNFLLENKRWREDPEFLEMKFRKMRDELYASAMVAPAALAVDPTAKPTAPARQRPTSQLV